MKKFTFRGGVHPFEGKDLTENAPVSVLEPGRELAFLLSQHIGAPAVPVVKKGDRVLTGQLLGEAGGFVSARVFSSVSGTVKGIEKRRNAKGALTDAVIVENDGLYESTPFEPLPGMEEYIRVFGLRPSGNWYGPQDLQGRDAQTVLDAVKPDEILKQMEPSQVLDRIRAAGLVGMGGAGFPTHVKLSPSDPEKIDYVLINGCECEPYVTCDQKLLCERPGELIAGLKAVLKLFGKVQGVFCIEDNKPDAIQILKKALRREENIFVAPCRTKYPEGAERSLIKAITYRDVNSKMLPADAGCIVVNVSSAYAIFEAVFLGKPDYERLMTVAGDAIATPGNYLVPNGMYYREIIQQAGGFTQTPEKLISGGPMMGFAQADTEGVSTKTSSAITALCYDIISREPETQCMNCGRCADACPARLVPSHLAHMVEKRRLDQFEENYGMECVNCGSCSWSCPARRPLAALISQGRQTLLAQKRKARK